MSRNVLFVTVDSLRADHCGFLGDADLTPTLDELARDGLVYEDAIAPGPRTPSSMPSVFTGECIGPVDLDGDESERESESEGADGSAGEDADGSAGEDADGGTAGRGDYWQRWRTAIRDHTERYRTVAQRFKQRGYSTIGFTVNPWTQGTGFDAGFDEFRHVNGATLEAYGPSLFRAADAALQHNGLGERVNWDNKREWFIRWTDVYDEIRRAIRAADEPYFVWLFLLDSHQPYIAPRPYREESSTPGMYYATLRELLSSSGSIPAHVESGLEAAYRDAVRSVDGFVDSLWRDCRDDDPVLVFHSDHGEAFGEHGTYGHERDLYRENLHVPVLVHNGPAQGRVSTPFSLRELPRVLTSVGADAGFDPEAFAAEYVVSTTERDDTLSVTGSTWKYVRTEGIEELYHRDRDPLEESNVAADYPRVTRSLATLADRRHRHRTERRAIAAVARRDGREFER